MTTKNVLENTMYSVENLNKTLNDTIVIIALVKQFPYASSTREE